MRSLVLLLFLVFLTSCKEKLDHTPIHPNIVLIIADDQGWGDLSYHGNTNLQTPNIDAIARNGTSFLNFYVQPVCSPSRAELLTGRFFPRLGVSSTSSGGERLNLNETTIAEVFRKAGYLTAIYGKWHNGMQPPYHPNARGFDDFYGFASGHWGNYFDPMLERNGKLLRGEGYIVDDLTNKALKFIDDNKNAPFFLYLPFNTPHSPMQVPDQHWDRFKTVSLHKRAVDSLKENLNFTKAALAMVENIDLNIGRISKRIEELDLHRRTIIVFLSDNGPNSWRWNGGMRGRKGSTDEGGVRTPFFIQWKDSIPNGRKVEQIASAIDILPTLARLANIEFETNEPIDGMDLSPLIFNKDVTWKSRMIYNHWQGQTSVRSQQFRLDHNDRLYDINNDRSQSIDVSNDHRSIWDSLINSKELWLAEMDIDKLNKSDRPFPLGHPDFNFTQLPARDAKASGHITRSNRFPNCSFFTNWISPEDIISWDVDILKSGKYEVLLYYTCKKESVGTTMQLQFAGNKISSEIVVSNDPPLKGMENDREVRIESYVKDFIPHSLGVIHLDKGRGPMILSAPKINGDQAVDVRLLQFNRVQ